MVLQPRGCNALPQHPAAQLKCLHAPVANRKRQSLGVTTTTRRRPLEMRRPKRPTPTFWPGGGAGLP